MCGELELVNAKEEKIAYCESCGQHQSGAICTQPVEQQRSGTQTEWCYCSCTDGLGWRYVKCSGLEISWCCDVIRCVKLTKQVRSVYKKIGLEHLHKSGGLCLVNWLVTDETRPEPVRWWWWWWWEGIMEARVVWCLEEADDDSFKPPPPTALPAEVLWRKLPDGEIGAAFPPPPPGNSRFPTEETKKYSRFPQLYVFHATQETWKAVRVHATTTGTPLSRN